ncbi:MSMEG_1061 family FMN-dependent PPOX-type flavoprotein [Herbiconiux daphne]|uniref:Pyridoxamine 5'-phosphate oxidase family protein n=1 Tax=Herbiconiux daphne TaxID=2970914 RepID=A0ABT2H7R8_9MICO|nr:MSMEG_1061 family FMN-dependent PPOX-type flavoprotein [Herbiconiux daphne]MCS5735964.1 pyridoxamine 5'-phosphate oxidase family protein [Herbiconiux daphne]
MTYPLTNPPVTSVSELEAVVGQPIERVAKKDRTHLEQVDREWLAASRLCFVATADADGACDVSPKGDPTGLVHVLDDSTIVIPERPGNRRVDGFRNVLANPHAGLIFVIPARSDTLRVAGRARIAVDEPFFDDLVVKGHRPKLALVIDIETVFFHCAKAFLRSQTWNPASWDGPEATGAERTGSGAVPAGAEIIGLLADPDESPDEFERFADAAASEPLY